MAPRNKTHRMGWQRGGQPGGTHGPGLLLGESTGGWGGQQRPPCPPHALILRTAPFPCPSVTIQPPQQHFETSGEKGKCLEKDVVNIRKLQLNT